MIPLEHWLILGTALFCIGAATMITRKNIIVMLMGIELMLNGANINLVAFNQIHQRKWSSVMFNDGKMFSLFVIVIAACEAAIALAIIWRVVKHYKTTQIDKLDKLKG